MDFEKFADGADDLDPTDPIALYDSLDPQTTHVDLRPAQIQILRTWSQRRTQRDIVLKLATGAGKTTVGLVTLYSHMLETRRPCMFLCPTNQLVGQVIQESKRCGVPAVEVLGGQEIPPEALSGSAVVVTSVHAIFQARAGRFEQANFYAILIDDAHAAVSIVKKQFSIEVPSKDPLYKKLFNLFRESLRAQSMGSAMEMEAREDAEASVAIGALEVPYWVWLQHIETVTQLFNERSTAEDALFRAKKPATLDALPLRWPLIRNVLTGCRCFFSARGLQISPEVPPVDRVRVYDRAERRIFMSATIADESVLVRELACDVGAAGNPLEVPDAGGIGERMVLVPRLMTTSASDALAWNDLAKVCQSIAKKHAVVVLTPSAAAAAPWAKFGAMVVHDTDDVPAAVAALRDGSKKFVVFTNRYDGIDLPDDACRLLVLDRAPVAYSYMDMVDMACKGAVSVRRQTVMHRIEQGMGRAVRSAADYAAVLLYGNDLVRLVSMMETRQHFTEQTRRQIELGIKIADEIRRKATAEAELEPLILQCLNRDAGWKKAYQKHAKARGVPERPQDHQQRLQQAGAERRAWTLHISKRGLEAASELRTFINTHNLGEDAKAFMLQRVAWYLYAQDRDQSFSVQTKARESDFQLLMPPDGVAFRKSAASTSSASAKFTRWVSTFTHVNGAIAYIEELRAALTFSPDHPHEKFEDALRELGDILGFESRRPDREVSMGPDVLWLEASLAVPLEAKNRLKEATDAISKHTAGQLMQAEGWTRQTYPEKEIVPISVHPVEQCGRQTVMPTAARVLTAAHLASILDALKSTVAALSAAPEVTATAASALLATNGLTLDAIARKRAAKPKPA